MEKIILTTPDELRVLIADTVRDAIHFNHTTHSSSLQATACDSATAQKYITAAQAAKYLNLSVHTLYGYTSNQKIPFIKKGKHLRFQRSELDAWLQEGKKASVSQIKAELRGEKQRK